jgi:carboxyl-terminal processing protease
VQTIINDPYPGMIYKDPIVILIKGIRLQQVSFAAQDYNRALLMGTGTVGNDHPVHNGFGKND